MVCLLMHCIAGSAAPLWSSLAFFLFFKYYFFCSTGGIGVLASYEATMILFATTFFFLVLV
ncbi:hypothetical protein FB192DRAFT_1406372, partial [Mucor lusitanicus]